MYDHDALESRVYICENDGLTFGCRLTYYINVVYAMYGRTRRDICVKSDVPTNGCKAAHSLQKLNTFIEDKCGVKPSMCVIEASSNVFGEPCEDTDKYLEMAYTCAPREESMFTYNYTVCLKEHKCLSDSK